VAKPFKFSTLLFGRLGQGYWVAFIVTIFFAALAKYLTGRSLIDYLPTGSMMSPQFFALVLAPLLITILVVTIDLYCRGAVSPTKILWRVFRRDKGWPIRALLMLAWSMVLANTFSALKVTIQATVPFYADPALAAFEHSLLGTDAWQLTHAIFGSPQMTMWIDRIYLIYFPMSGAFGIWLAVSRDLRFQLRGLLILLFAYFVLGYGVALAVSSCGPVFYEVHYRSAYFAPLTERLKQISETHGLAAIFFTDWLVSNATEGRFGKGISAFPSLHVGGIFIYYLLVRHRLGTWHAATIIMLLAVIAVWIGSVHLAWHYAVDGFASIALIAIVWPLIGRYVDHLWNRRESFPDVRLGDARLAKEV